MGRGAIVAVVLGLGCTEYGYTSQKQKDVFQQKRRNTVDVLMVVDNSCSMVEEQNKLADNFQAFIGAFEGIDVDWQMGVVTTDTESDEFKGRLVGGDDEIVLSCDGREIDKVAWTWDWEVAEGAALALDPASYASSKNDTAANWCLGVDAFGAGDLGTPGSPNPPCAARSTPPAGDGGADDTGGDTGDAGGDDAASTGAGDVIITEFLADPGAVSDAFGEWLELTNLDTVPHDLSGCTLSDDGGNEAAIPDGTTIDAGAALVVGRSTDTSTNGGAPVDVALDGGLTLNNKVRILTPETEGPEEVFAEMVAVGTSGSGIEMGLEAARLALSQPLLGDHNAGMVRDDANLSLIFVSDEDDYSPHAVNDYYRNFGGVKGDDGFREAGRVVMSAVVGSDPPSYDGVPSCESSDGVAAYGQRYVDLANRTAGALESICDDDFSPIAYELGLTVSGLELEFVLSDAAVEDSIVVKLYESQDERSLVGELEKDVDWTYVFERNSIRFEADKVPPSETWVVVEYEVLAEGSTQSDATESAP